MLVWTDQWGHDPSFQKYQYLVAYFRFQAPLVPLCEYTPPPSECWLGPLTWQEKKSPPHHLHFNPYQTQVQISGSDTLVKPAGLKSYVSLPSACIQVLAFLVCTDDLLQWACLSLQDIGLQQELMVSMVRDTQEAITREASLSFATGRYSRWTTTRTCSCIEALQQQFQIRTSSNQYNNQHLHS